MSAPIRVLHVLGKFEGGGIQMFLLELLRCRDRDRFQMDVCEMTQEPGALIPDVEAAGIRTFRCPLSDSPFTFGRRFGALLKRNEYDAVHLHRSSNVQGIPLRVADTLGVPVRIAHYQNAYRPSGALTFRGLTDPTLRRMVLRHATHVLGVSSAVLDSQFGTHWHHDARFRMMPNATDLKKFGDRSSRNKIREELNITPGQLIIGHAGRFSPARNHRLIVDIARLVCAEHANVKFLLVGDGPDRRAVEEDIDRKGLRDRFILAESREDMEDVYQAMDLFLFPSLWEGLALALIEAQASGLPCVASDIQSNLEVLAPELHPLTHPPNDLHAVEKALSALITDPEKRETLGMRAREHAAQFDIRIIAREIETLYYPPPE